MNSVREMVVFFLLLEKPKCNRKQERERERERVIAVLREQKEKEGTKKKHRE